MFILMYPFKTLLALSVTGRLDLDCAPVYSMNPCSTSKVRFSHE